MNRKTKFLVGIVSYIVAGFVPLLLKYIIGAPFWYFIIMEISWCVFILTGWYELIFEWVDKEDGN